MLRGISFKESALKVMKTTLVSMMRNICQAWIGSACYFVCVNHIKKALEEYEIKRILTGW